MPACKGCERQETKALSLSLSNISSSRFTDGRCAAGLIVEADQRDTHCWGGTGVLPGGALPL